MRDEMKNVNVIATLESDDNSLSAYVSSHDISASAIARTMGELDKKLRETLQDALEVSKEYNLEYPHELDGANIHILYELATV